MKFQTTTILSAAGLFAFAAASPANLPAKRQWFSSIEAGEIEFEDENYPDEIEFEHVNYPDVKTTIAVVKNITDELRAYVHDEHIDYTSFRKRMSSLENKIHEYAYWYGEQQSWDDDAYYLLILYGALKVNVEWREKFNEEVFWGSDLVNSIGELYVRVLVAEIDATGPQNDDFDRKITRLDHRFAEIKHRAKDMSMMPQEVKDFVERAIDVTEEEFQMIKKEVSHKKNSVDS